MESTSHDPALPEPPTPIAPIRGLIHELTLACSHLAKAFKYLLVAVYLPAVAGMFPTPPTLTAPTPDLTQELSLARSNLAKAFKYLLVAVYLPIIAGVLCFANLFTYYKSHVRLCDVTRYCDDLLGAPLALTPLTLAYIFFTCFTLDYYLSKSPVFKSNLQKESRSIPQVQSDNRSGIQPATDADSLGPARNHDDGNAKRKAWGVLRILTVLSYALVTAWTVSSLAAIAGAGLVLKFDAPFDPNGGNPAHKDRVIFGFAAGAAHALLAFAIGWAAIVISRAGNSSILAVAVDCGQDPTVAEGTQETPDAEGPRDGLRLLSHRSTLEKAVLCLLVSLTLSFISGTFSLVYDPFSHLRHIKSSPYSSACFFTSFFTWFLTLVSHRYRSNGVSPGTVVRAFMSLVSLVMATVWLLASGTYLFLCVGALFCDEHVPLPTSSPCAYIRKSEIWTGFVACAFGYLQAYILGCIALLSWESRGGIRLAEEEDGENVVIE
ncbi:hypothetical protein FA13DRAFT_1740472 [Coprinellus micaceus]|uniref:Uncharacterized protein n=1 Tax=Coprinellus micaceus TaxID=71717 RepID=A0A4Y7SMN3_COPMI|nr:hypothetical protein FA13DRAFT_1740472 [Coprinellus micaceus]